MTPLRLTPRRPAAVAAISAGHAAPASGGLPARVRRLALVAAATLAVALTPALRASAAGVPAGTPTTHRLTTPVSYVGPLFFHGLNSDHNCVATVVGSPRGNVIVAAAHCFSGTGKGVQFAPGYTNGRTPYGVWTITGLYAAPAYLSSRDWEHDYVFATVANTTYQGHVRTLQSVAGAVALHTASNSIDESTSVPSYVQNNGDSQVSCTTSLTLSRAAGRWYPTFTCNSYPGGTSGSPFLTTAAGSTSLTGVIGGLHEGGCVAWVSYSSWFGADVAGVLKRADAGGAADSLPASASDGC